jgi:hypothetical protein
MVLEFSGTEGFSGRSWQAPLLIAQSPLNLIGGNLDWTFFKVPYQRQPGYP